MDILFKNIFEQKYLNIPSLPLTLSCWNPFSSWC